jgi:hypothetical protein
VSLGNVLTASTSFAILSVFNTLRYPFLSLPVAVRSIVGAQAAFARLEAFLISEEVEEMEISEPPPDSDLAFEIVFLSFNGRLRRISSGTAQTLSLNSAISASRRRRVTRSLSLEMSAQGNRLSSQHCLVRSVRFLVIKSKFMDQPDMFRNKLGF